MEWAKNAQEATSLSDLYSYPKGYIQSTIAGFWTTQVITYAVLAILAIYVIRKITNNRNQVMETQHKVQLIQMQYTVNAAGRTTPEINSHIIEIPDNITTSEVRQPERIAWINQPSFAF